MLTSFYFRQHQAALAFVKSLATNHGFGQNDFNPESDFNVVIVDDANRTVHHGAKRNYCSSDITMTALDVEVPPAKGMVESVTFESRDGKSLKLGTYYFSRRSLQFLLDKMDTQARLVSG